MEQEKISAAQLRAARGLVGWTQAKLANAAKVSSMTVKRAEGSGQPYPSDAALFSLRTALEAAGIQFITENGGGPGVRFKERNTNV